MAATGLSATASAVNPNQVKVVNADLDEEPELDIGASTSAGVMGFREKKSGSFPAESTSYSPKAVSPKGSPSDRASQRRGRKNMLEGSQPRMRASSTQDISELGGTHAIPMVCFLDFKP